MSLSLMELWEVVHNPKGISVRCVFSTLHLYQKMTRYLFNIFYWKVAELSLLSSALGMCWILVFGPISSTVHMLCFKACCIPYCTKQPAWRMRYFKHVCSSSSGWKDVHQQIICPQIVEGLCSPALVCLSVDLGLTHFSLKAWEMFW